MTVRAPTRWQIASTAAASGPAIYNYTWLLLMLPFGMIGVTAFGLLFTPVFYVVMRAVSARLPKARR